MNFAVRCNGKLDPIYLKNPRGTFFRTRPRTAYVPNAPFVYRDENGTFRGLMYDLALTLTTALNFTMELAATDIYGEELANGSWAGVVGMLQRREADITVNDFSITQSRSKVGERGGMKNLGGSGGTTNLYVCLTQNCGISPF